MCARVARSVWVPGPSTSPLDSTRAVPQSAPKASRSAFWYVKFVFACYGAGVGATILLLVFSLPFIEFRTWITVRHAGVEPLGVATLAFAIAVAPLMWKRLR